MKWTIPTLCTLFLLSTSFVYAQATTPAPAPATGTASSTMGSMSGDPAAEASLQKMETELSQAAAAHDTAPFTKYLDDNITALGPGWHSNSKAEVMTSIKSMACTSSNPTLSGFSTKWLTPDMALVTYVENYTMTCQGKAMPTVERDSSLWQKKNGAWLAVFHQATTELPPMAGGS